MNDIECEICAASVVNADENKMSVKNRGGLVFPSSDVVKIMKVCEIAFKDIVQKMISEIQKCLLAKILKVKLGIPVVSELRIKNVFTVLNNNHFLNEAGSEDLHSTQLIEIFISKYLDIRMFCYGKVYEQPDY